jgi:tRNA(Arg) A34 adenosine deaminase TadA
MRDPEVALPFAASRRGFLQSLSLAATASVFSEPRSLLAAAQETATNQAPEVAGLHEKGLDEKRMRELAAWTALTMDTPNPVPFGAEIFDTERGESLMRAANAVRAANDPSAHAEVHTIRLACRKLNAHSLAGYTLYTTCEPCAMCMACALWAGLDRVVFGATITDAARFVHQIRVPAAEIAMRSDMKCAVTGPVAQDVCLALFTNPIMQKAFKTWNSPKP